MGPYAYKDRQWVGYDDAATLRRKAEYIRSMGLGGGMVWALDLDDFSNRCGLGCHIIVIINIFLSYQVRAGQTPADARYQGSAGAGQGG